VPFVTTVRVKGWVAFGETPFVPVMVIGKLPADVGVPLSTPADEKLTPPGKPPVSLNVGAGNPVAVTGNEPAEPKVKVALLALVINGAWSTVRVSEAVVPVPPLVALTVPVVLLLMPLLVAVTFTETAQLLLTGIDPPLRLIVVAAAGAVNVPPQVLVAPGVLATCIPAGKASLTATPVRVTVLAAGLVMVRVRVEVPFTLMGSGAKALVIVGAALTAKLAEAVVPAPPFVELTVPVVLV
jgi:hypothetical protein